MTTETVNTATAAQRRFPSVWTGLIWLVAFFGVQILVTIPVVITYGIVTGKMDDIASGTDTIGFLREFAVPFMWAIAASGAVTLMALWYYLVISPIKYTAPITGANNTAAPQSRADIIGLNTWGKLAFGNAAVICGAVLIAAYVFNFLYSTYVIPDINSQETTTILINSVPKTPLNWVLLFAAISILPGITEELVFRGLLQNSFAHHMNAGYAIALSSGIFAAVHLQPAAFPALMSLGAAFGYIYHKTGSMRINILLHAFNNGAALLLNQVA
jgi:membrane protease YdiL (CAAX protease family)